MKKIVIDALVTIFICAGLFFLLQYFAEKTGLFLPLGTRHIYQLLQAFIILFCLYAFFYKRLWNSGLFRSPLKGSLFLFSIVTLLFIIYHSLSLNKNILAYYRYFSSDNFISWKGRMYERDSLLGYRMRPDNFSSLVYDLKQPVPVKTDRNGFRVAHTGEQFSDVNKPVDLLFLGCSFTFGSACKAEETFPYIVARESGMNYINAAVGGYGLAQMMLLANQLIPKYKPRYIIIQRSPWLIERSLSEFAPSRGGYVLPTPYFIEKGNEFAIDPPVYQSPINELLPEEDRKIYKGNFLRYYFKKGISYFGNQQIQIIKTRIGNILGHKKRPTDREQEAELFAYSEIIKLAREHGVEVILLHLNNGPITFKANLPISNYSYRIANADSALRQRLSSADEQEYVRMFGHWGTKGSDSVFIDGHPNPLAHKLIATSILEQLPGK
ncbi:hypothetical protein WG954_10065 [Lacibacter sp. H375]|uniref:SGNH/GDSL hydrolase family protein n=1 Tax=Lacibacter sp. H375 TaxID=3133424 RepID=UPI0030C1DDF1